MRISENLFPAICFVGIVVGIAQLGHEAYRNSHTKLKPVVAEPFIVPCSYRQGEVYRLSVGMICGEPVLSRPNLSHGFEVTPRKHKRKPVLQMTFSPQRQSTEELLKFVNPNLHVTQQKLKEMQDRGQNCILRINLDCWVTLDPEPAPSDEEMKLERPKAAASSQDTIWPTLTGTAQIQLTQKQKEAFPSNAWIKLCGPENGADACYVPSKPSCVMPADIDVCPIQMMVPKETPHIGWDTGKE